MHDQKQERRKTSTDSQNLKFRRKLSKKAFSRKGSILIEEKCVLFGFVICFCMGNSDSSDLDFLCFSSEKKWKNEMDICGN